MGAALPKGLSEKLLLMVMMMIMVIQLSTSNHIYASGTMSQNTNGTTSIADEELELEFLMDSETSRRILAAIRFQTPGSTNRNNAAFCGRGRYRSCTGTARPAPRKDSCATYKRNCPINR